MNVNHQNIELKMCPLPRKLYIFFKTIAKSINVDQCHQNVKLPVQTALNFENILKMKKKNTNMKIKFRSHNNGKYSDKNSTSSL